MFLPPQVKLSRQSSAISNLSDWRSIQSSPTLIEQEKLKRKYEIIRKKLQEALEETSVKEKTYHRNAKKAEMENSALKWQIHQLNFSLQAAHQNNAILHAQAQNCYKEITRLNHVQQNNQQTISNLHGQLEQIHSQNNALEEKLQSSQRKCQAAERSIASLRARIQNLEEKKHLWF